MRRVLIVLALVITASIGNSTTPAHAAGSGTVKVSYGGHHCAAIGGNKVIAVQVSISDGGTEPFVQGDTATTWARFGVPQWINGAIRCSRVYWTWWGQRKEQKLLMPLELPHPDRYPRYFWFEGHRVWM